MTTPYTDPSLPPIGSTVQYCGYDTHWWTDDNDYGDPQTVVDRKGFAVKTNKGIWMKHTELKTVP